MGSATTTFAVPYPVGTDRVMDGDNAMQAMAERLDLLLGGAGGASSGTMPVNAPGIWQAVTGTTICTDTTTAMASGATVSESRFMKIGKSVWFRGYGTTANVVTNVAVLLPNGVAGTPVSRHMWLPGMNIQGASVSASMSGAGIMSTDLLKAIWMLNTNAYVTTVAGQSVRWSILYEVA